MATLEQSVLVVAIAAAAALELFFIVRAVIELRSARIYRELLADVRRIERR